MHVALNTQQAKDIRIIARFTAVWCHGHHHEDRRQFILPGLVRTEQLCPDCASFMEYAIAKRLKCPLEPGRPSCKHCRIHCYAPQQRDLVKKIMSWSGRRMILRGRLDYLWHYFF